MKWDREPETWRTGRGDLYATAFKTEAGFYFTVSQRLYFGEDRLLAEGLRVNRVEAQQAAEVFIKNYRYGSRSGGDEG